MTGHYEHILCPTCKRYDLLFISRTINGIEYKHTCPDCGTEINETNWNSIGHLHHADSNDLLPYIKSDSVDLVLTDPPFGVRKDEEWDDKELFIKMVGSWLFHSLRISRHGVIWFCASKMMPYILREVDPELFHRQLDWKKPKGSQYAGASHNNIWYAKEPILVFSKDLKKTTSYGKNEKFNYDFLEYDTIAKSKANHKTPKPVGLIAKLILHYSEKGETILDPFTGSGTLAEACIRTGRKYICIERSPEPNKPITDVDGDNPDHIGTIKNRIINLTSQEDFLMQMREAKAVQEKLF